MVEGSRKNSRKLESEEGRAIISEKWAKSQKFQHLKKYYNEKLGKRKKILGKSLEKTKITTLKRIE